MTEEIKLAEVDDIVGSLGDSQEAIVPILRAVQDKYNYLPENVLRHICEITSITPAAMHGVSTFYSQFRHRPAGEHRIKVCIGTACHVKGAETVLNTFKQFLEIPANDDTDADRLFTVEKVACLGCCMLAPAVQIDDVT
jgi:NADH:ubiquinone oxidoreductase subunit E